MKKLAWITAISLIALSSTASAQHGAGETGIRPLPIVQMPMPVTPVLPTGR